MGREEGDTAGSIEGSIEGGTAGGIEGDTEGGVHSGKGARRGSKRRGNVIIPGHRACRIDRKPAGMRTRRGEGRFVEAHQKDHVISMPEAR